ncbi:CrcB protein [Marininema halotolerans]|uniref:Fluoride-specific ion channel FluC n=2 Tax=Marininema halotolerans TaxID=1155944 RepID=A0A1I6R2C8_9BACL|nr:CrcB protein [Marininema halotolerans]
MPYLLIGIAGACGALLRYGLSVLLVSEGTSFPWVTLLINYLGCLLLTWLNEKKGPFQSNPALNTAITTGFIGSFTTFSTFSVETITLIHTGQILLALLYLLLSVWGGFAFAWLGAKLASSTTPYAKEGDQ